ncbi:MAG: CHASE2 domain-containing protein [Pseudomonadota bacterium]
MLPLLFPVLLAAFLYATNPFHILDETAKVSQRITQRAYSLLFDQKLDAQPVVAVVLDEGFVDKFAPDTGYPVGFDVHAVVLRTILCAAPSSLYIDIAFQAPRANAGAEQTDEEAVERLRAALATRATDPICQKLDAAKRPVDTEVFLARVLPEQGLCSAFPFTKAGIEDCPRVEALEPLRNVSTPLSITRTQPEIQHIRYPLFANASNALRFLVQDLEAAKARMPQVEPSPATAMALAYCRNQSPGQDILALCQTLQTAKPSSQFERLPADLNMVPLWRYYSYGNPLWQQLLQSPSRNPESTNLDSAKADPSAGGSCTRYQRIEAGQDTFLRRVGVAIIAVLTEGLNQALPETGTAGSKPFSQTNCLTHPYVVGDVVEELRSSCRLPRGCSGALSTLFEGKAVVYGYSVDVANDMFDTPVLGQLPGLFVHAAATDNLLRFGTSYKREGITVLGMEIDSNLIQLFIIAGFFVVQLVFTMGKIGSSGRWSLVLALSAFAILMPPFMNLPPLDWLATISLGQLSLLAQRPSAENRVYVDRNP